MKKIFALIFALLLLLTACGQEAAQTQQESTDPAKADPKSEEPPTTEGIYVKEGVLDDGTKYTIYRNGGPEGTPVRVV